ncbi:BspA family leucine-rich repeat surface protein [Bombilactobacillus mellis]|uniref:BspA family leucine-rich repeat surface protein n=2 Tax=Bombilactobacillus mellis TaxID=1218508 RepID=UPI0005F923A0
MALYFNKLIIIMIVIETDVIAPKIFSYLFSGFNNFREFVDLSNFVTSQINNMQGMFADSPNLEKVNVKNFNTKNMYRTVFCLNVENYEN